MDNTDTLITYCGITAPASLWRANYFETYSNGTIARGPDRHEADLAAARLASGADDWRALAQYKIERERQQEEKTRSTSISRLAEALNRVADSSKETVLNDILSQLTERTQYAVRQQLKL